MTSSKPGFIKRMFGAEAVPDVARREAFSDAVVPAEAAPRVPPSPFGEFGEKGERVGEQIAYFISRLDELYSLRQEFASVAKPMQEFIVSHAEAQTRLAEATALLTRERSDAQALRAETHTIRASHARLENALAETSNQIKLHEDAADGRTAQLRSLQIAHDDAASRLDWSTRQLAAETQSNLEHAEARRAAGDELNRTEQELAFEKTRHLELKDQHEALNSEAHRLQGVVERIQPALSAAKRRTSELENDLSAAKATIGMLELKIAGEQDLRRATELARTQEKLAADNEVAALTLQVEALEGRNATTTKIFEQSRALLNEKIEQIRHLERTAKDHQADKAIVDRRHAAAQEEIRRLVDSAAVLGSRQQETQERSAMLTNAMAAKDAQIEQLDGRSVGLKNQLDDVTARYEQERLATEGHNRKLIEEVQSERAERALAQGALSIARNSREKLLLQIEELKRQRFGQLPESLETPEARINRDTQNNIHHFRTPEPTDTNA